MPVRERDIARSLRPALGDKLVVLGVLVAVIAAIAAFTIGRPSKASTFCDIVARGTTANQVLGSYLRSCGSDYTLAKGPYNAYKPTTPYASYTRVVEYTLNIANNNEGSQGFLEVGQRVPTGSWRTLGPLGTGP